jgi:DNA-binding NarL/FixJ family response regulator
MSQSATGLLVSNDLMFTSKVTGTARALGLRVLVAGTKDEAVALLACESPRVLIVDLAGGVAATQDALLAYRGALAPGAAMLAFGSHVDKAALAAAVDAGCDEVMPRSKFSMELPRLLVRYLSDTPALGG